MGPSARWAACLLAGLLAAGLFTAEAQELRMITIYPGGRPLELITPAKGTVYFLGGWPRRLWKSDGSAAGTRVVSESLEFHEGVGGDTTEDLLFTGRFLFLPGAGPEEKGQELYRSNGTAAGTNLVKDIELSRVQYGRADSYNEFIEFGYNEFIEFDGRLFFTVKTQGHVNETTSTWT
jgi:hypothetical protein